PGAHPPVTPRGRRAAPLLRAHGGRTGPRGRRAHAAGEPRAPHRHAPARGGTGMSAHRRTLGAYRLAIRLYPKRFREEYGPDLAGLLADQLRDEPAWRVVARRAVDLPLPVPTRHLEARMARTPTAPVP